MLRRAIVGSHSLCAQARSDDARNRISRSERCLDTLPDYIVTALGLLHEAVDV